jgi:hypothetical protein
MIETFDDPEHRGRLRRFRHLAQPGEPALVGIIPAARQRIESVPLIN